MGDKAIEFNSLLNQLNWIYAVEVKEKSAHSVFLNSFLYQGMFFSFC